MPEIINTESTSCGIVCCGSEKAMGCHLAKPWATVGCTLPLVEKNVDHDEECEERWCWCLFPPYHRHMRDMEVVVDPSAPSEKEGVHGDISRSPAGRDVHVGFPALPEDTPKSVCSSRAASDSQSNSDDADVHPGADAGDVPELIRHLAESIHSATGDDTTLTVAGLPLSEFWAKLLLLESSGGKHGKAVARADKMLRFRQRWSWPLSIGVRQVEAALRSGATIYLPPRWPGDSHLLVFTAQKLNTRLCTMQEYQLLILFMMEAALRDSRPDHPGITIVLDVRLLSSVIWQACLSGWNDMRRGIELCSALPIKAPHVQLIEDEARWVATSAVQFFLSKFGSKMRSRVHRGGPQAAIDKLGTEILPDFLGGRRDSMAEFSSWLEKSQLANPVEIASASIRSSAA